jgi:hypothetical protein
MKMKSMLRLFLNTVTLYCVSGGMQLLLQKKSNTKLPDSDMLIAVVGCIELVAGSGISVRPSVSITSGRNNQKVTH